MFVRPISHIAGKRNRAPVWQTNAGSLGSYTEGDVVNVQLSAPDPDKSDTVSYSVTSGALPPGVILSTAGKISGAIGTVAEVQTVYNFTVTASDGPHKVPRAFMILVRKVVNALVGGALSTATAVRSLAAVAGSSTMDVMPALGTTIYAMASFNAQIFAAGTVEAANPTTGATQSVGSIIVSSGDGTWRTAFTTPLGSTIRVMAASPTMLIAVGDAGFMVTTADGIAWTTATSPGGSANITALKWDGTRWWLGAGKNLYTSTNGTNWTTISFGATVGATITAINDVASNGNNTVLVAFPLPATGTAYPLARSTDNGTTWALQAPVATTGQTAVVSMEYSPALNMWFRCGTNLSNCYRSADGGVTWAIVSFNPAITGQNPNRVARTPNGVAFAIQDKFAATTDSSGNGIGVVAATLTYRAVCHFPGNNCVYFAGGLATAGSTSVASSTTIIRFPYNGNAALGTQATDLSTQYGGIATSNVTWTGREFVAFDTRLVSANGFDWYTPPLTNSSGNASFYFPAMTPTNICFDQVGNKYIVPFGSGYYSATDLGGPYDPVLTTTTISMYSGSRGPRTNGTVCVLPCILSNVAGFGVGNLSSGFTFKPTPSTYAGQSIDAAWTGQKWLIVNGGNYVVSTADFATYTGYKPGTDTGLKIASDGAGNAVLCTNQNRYLSTDHGATWTNIGATADTMVAYSATLNAFIVVGTNTTGHTSPNIIVFSTYRSVAGR